MTRAWCCLVGRTDGGWALVGSLGTLNPAAGHVLGVRAADVAATTVN